MSNPFFLWFLGLCVPKVGKNAFEIAKNYVDKTVIVRYKHA